MSQLLTYALVWFPVFVLRPQMDGRCW